MCRSDWCNTAESGCRVWFGLEIESIPCRCIAKRLGSPNIWNRSYGSGTTLTCMTLERDHYDPNAPGLGLLFRSKLTDLIRLGLPSYKIGDLWDDGSYYRRRKQPHPLRLRLWITQTFASNLKEVASTTSCTNTASSSDTKSRQSWYRRSLEFGKVFLW